MVQEKVGVALFHRQTVQEVSDFAAQSLGSDAGVSSMESLFAAILFYYIHFSPLHLVNVIEHFYHRQDLRLDVCCTWLGFFPNPRISSSDSGLHHWCFPLSLLLGPIPPAPSRIFSPPVHWTSVRLGDSCRCEFIFSPFYLIDRLFPPLILAQRFGNDGKKWNFVRQRASPKVVNVVYYDASVMQASFAQVRERCCHVIQCFTQLARLTFPFGSSSLLQYFSRSPPRGSADTQHQGHGQVSSHVYRVHRRQRRAVRSARKHLLCGL